MGDAMTTFVLTPPPSANAMYYNVAGAGRRKTRQYQAWIRGELKDSLPRERSRLKAAPPFQSRFQNRRAMRTTKSNQPWTCSSVLAS